MIKSLVVGGELADVKLYGFGTLEKIDLEKELTGQSTFLVDAAVKCGESVCLYGIEFFMRELRRVSAELIWSKLAEKSDGIISIVRTFDDTRKERVKRLQERFALPVAVCCGDHLFSFGARSPQVVDIN